VLGSASDGPKVEPAIRVLRELAVPFEVQVLSAHRDPAAVAAYADGLAGRGVRCVIGCAGMAAHLAGALAARTLVPVIGLPLSGGVLDGLDALLSTACMPPGTPVATVGVDGAENAALLAAQVVAVADPDLGRRLAARRAAQAAARAARGQAWLDKVAEGASAKGGGQA
jgi:5-(carboxyamino)imidazole ribonucleotide mutase